MKSIEKVVSGAISTEDNGQRPANFDAISNSDDDFIDPQKLKKR